MTLLAYRLERDFVEVVSDTLAVADNAAYLFDSSKVQYIPHLDLALAGTGLGYIAKYVALDVGDLASAPYDELVPKVQQIVQKVAAELADSNPDHAAASATILYAFGYSERRRRCMGSLFMGGGPSAPWEREWQAVDALYDHPAYRGDGRGSSARIWPRALGSSFDIADAAPEGPLGWVELATRLRREMIDTPPERRIVFGGDLIYTRLEQGGVTQRRIFRFDDTGEEFAQLLAGTANPLGAPHRWPGVGRNDPCPCGSGEKYKRCHDPQAAR